MTKSSTAARFAPAARNVTAEDEREAPFEKGALALSPKTFEAWHGTRRVRIACPVFFVLAAAVGRREVYLIALGAGGRAGGAGLGALPRFPEGKRAAAFCGARGNAVGNPAIGRFTTRAPENRLTARRRNVCADTTLHECKLHVSDLNPKERAPGPLLRNPLPPGALPHGLPAKGGLVTGPKGPAPSGLPG